METFWKELTTGLPDAQHLTVFVIRILAAVIFGAVIGFERERAGKAAGLRTHILVALGTCMFVMVCTFSGMTSDGLSRVIQGIVTGLGFLGAGAIFKASEHYEIKGLTTAAGIWMTAAIGISAGLGMVGMAFLATLITLAVLVLVRRAEHKNEKE
jgi:putative Mg2+ transporter-C (MgtC) family protein